MLIEEDLEKAIFDLRWATAPGTPVFFAFLLSIPVLGATRAHVFRACGVTLQQMKIPIPTIAIMLGLSYLTKHAGMDAILGHAFASTGALYPLFAALLGWLGVFLTGSDTSANLLFGNLAVITANQLGLDPAMMAGATSAGGVMGKMISLQSIAVAAAATGMKADDEAKLFRFTLRHSVFLASVIGLLTVFYAYAG
jgi:lactate permease